MPRSAPTLSYTHIRDYAERFTWIDPATGERQTGFNPPDNAVDKQKVPFNIVYLTSEGIPHKGRVVCIKVNPAYHTRLIQYIDSGEIRQVSDSLIVSIDGVRFVTH